MEEIQAKKVPLRLELTITQLLKSLFFLYIRDVARFFALLGIFIWKDFRKAVLIDHVHTAFKPQDSGILGIYERPCHTVGGSQARE